MSDPVAVSPSAPALPNDNYEAFLAGVRERFRKQTEQDRPSLFTTRTSELFDVFLSAAPPALRQVNTCSTCRRFVRRYGGLVRVEADGATVPVLWDPASAHEPYGPAIRALASAVARAPIDGVFLSEEKVWGAPRTEAWTHLAVEPPADLLFRPTVLVARWQAVAAKKHDFETLSRGLQDFSMEIVDRAHSLLAGEKLFRPEKCLGPAKWLLELHQRLAGVKSPRAREALIWASVAGAPPGFCHVRSSMLGALLEDLAAGLPFGQIKMNFDTRMDPLKYQRPQAAPTAGNVAQAEKIIEKLQAAGALERRFAKLSDIHPLWTPAKGAPKKDGKKEKKGVFSHLLPGAKSAARDMDLPVTTITWEKFARTVLPTAEAIEFLVPDSEQAYLGMVTAKNPEAPPILQWDREDRRNPVSCYVYHGGSKPQRWGLKPGTYHAVTAVALQPSSWTSPESTHHGQQANFLLEGAKDLEYTSGAGFFPESLKSEFHPIRATLEAHAKTAVISGKDEAEACGICLSKGGTWNLTFRVTSKGIRALYKLDRWD